MKLGAGILSTPEQFMQLDAMGVHDPALGQPAMTALFSVWEMADWEWSAVRWSFFATKDHPWGLGMESGPSALASIIFQRGVMNLGEVLQAYRKEMGENAQKHMDVMGFPVEFRIEPPEPYKPKFEDCSGMEKRKGAVGA